MPANGVSRSKISQSVTASAKTSDARSFFLPFKSSGEDHWTVKPPCVEAPTVWVIVFDRSFASDMPKSHKQTDPFERINTLSAFKSPWTMAISGECKYATPVAVSAAYRVSSELSMDVSFSSSIDFKEPLSHSSMTIQPKAGHTPNIFITLGWFNEHKMVDSRRIWFLISSGTTASFGLPLGLNMHFTATATEVPVLERLSVPL